MEHGHAAVDLSQNGGADLIRPGADDLDLGAAVAQHQHLVHDDGVGDDQHDAVEHLLRLAERCLHQQDGDIKEHHGDGHRPAEPFLQHQRGDIHAACGSARPDDHAQRNADTQTREDGAEEDILSQHPAVQQPLKQPQKGGAQHAAGKGVQCELPAQHRPAPHQHGHVEEEEETGDGKPRQPPEGQRDTGGTARDEPGRLQKQGHRQRIQCVAQDDSQTVQQKLLPATSRFHSSTSHTILIIQENFKKIYPMRLLPIRTAGLMWLPRTPPLGELAQSA